MAERFVEELRTAQRTTRGEGVTVAILSTGVDTRFGPLDGVVKSEHDLVHGSQPVRLSGAVAAFALAAQGPRSDAPMGPGHRGMVPAIKVLSVRVRPESTEPDSPRFYRSRSASYVVAEGIRYAVDHGADVILVDAYMEYAVALDLSGAVGYANSRNVVVVAGAMSSGHNDWDERLLTYPALIPGVIGVTALDGVTGRPTGRLLAKDSSVLIGAPVGSGLPEVALFGERLATFTAATIVTGVAAMIRSENPDLPPAQVAAAISRSAHHPAGGYDPGVGFGVINPVGALKEARKLADSPIAVQATTGTFRPRAHFDGEGAGKVRAVPLNKVALAGLGGLAGAGLLALLAAVIVLARGRRRPVPVAEPAVAADSAAADAGAPESASEKSP